MNISMQLAVVVAAACLCLSDAAPEARLARKSQRPTRGFKNVEMLTARGFGKRDHPPTRSEQDDQGFLEPLTSLNCDPKTALMVAQELTNIEEHMREGEEELGLDNFWTLLESPEGEGLEGDGKLESIPMDWFVNEMLNNPDFARSVVRKFIDLNQDGMLSTDELLRNVD